MTYLWRQQVTKSVGRRWPRVKFPLLVQRSKAIPPKLMTFLRDGLDKGSLRGWPPREIPAVNSFVGGKMISFVREFGEH